MLFFVVCEFPYIYRFSRVPLFSCGACSYRLSCGVLTIIHTHIHTRAHVRARGFLDDNF